MESRNGKVFTFGRSKRCDLFLQREKPIKILLIFFLNIFL